MAIRPDFFRFDYLRVERLQLLPLLHCLMNLQLVFAKCAIFFSGRQTVLPLHNTMVPPLPLRDILGVSSDPFSLLFPSFSHSSVLGTPFPRDLPALLPQSQKIFSFLLLLSLVHALFKRLSVNLLSKRGKLLPFPRTFQPPPHRSPFLDSHLETLLSPADLFLLLRNSPFATPPFAHHHWKTSFLSLFAVYSFSDW